MKYEQPWGVPEQKKQPITEKLGPLMGPRQMKFFQELVESNVTGMIDNLL